MKVGRSGKGKKIEVGRSCKKIKDMKYTIEIGDWKSKDGKTRWGRPEGDGDMRSICTEVQWCGKRKCKEE